MVVRPLLMNRETLEPFVRRHIDSAETLETLLLLFRAQTAWWTAGKAAAALHLERAVVRNSLERLSGAFLEVKTSGDDVCFRFATLNAEREALTAALERAYHDDRTALLRMIAHGGAARDFADAFRVKEEEP
jgi:hypothetical protein